MTYVRKSAAQVRWRMEQPATLNQANPVQNTWYTLLNTPRPARILHINAGVTGANETVELRITINGEVLTTIGEAMTAGAVYDLVWQLGYLQWADMGGASPWQWSPIEGQGLLIELRKTTALGALSLVARCYYETAE